MLTDTAIRKTKPTDKDQKLWDSHRLYQLMRPNGSRWRRWDYLKDFGLFGVPCK